MIDIIKKLSGIVVKSDPTPFNMLNILYQDVYQKEKAHDKLFAGLLNSNQNHGFNDLLLREFLVKIEIEKNEIEEMKDVCVELNRNVKGRFIDIFLSWKNAKDKKCAIIIENKLHGAYDQKDQLRDYYFGINESYDIRKVVYMPFSKKLRSVKNYPNLENEIKNISIDFDANDIIEWLRGSIETAKNENKNTSILEQKEEKNRYFEYYRLDEIINVAINILEAIQNKRYNIK